MSYGPYPGIKLQKLTPDITGINRNTTFFADGWALLSNNLWGAPGFLQGNQVNVAGWKNICVQMDCYYSNPNSLTNPELQLIAECYLTKPGSQKYEYIIGSAAVNTMDAAAGMSALFSQFNKHGGNTDFHGQCSKTWTNIDLNEDFLIMARLMFPCGWARPIPPHGTQYFNIINIWIDLTLLNVE